jgi:hypothetical protein
MNTSINLLLQVIRQIWAVNPPHHHCLVEQSKDLVPLPMSNTDILVSPSSSQQSYPSHHSWSCSPVHITILAIVHPLQWTICQHSSPRSSPTPSPPASYPSTPYHTSDTEIATPPPGSSPKNPADLISCPTTSTPPQTETSSRPIGFSEDHLALLKIRTELANPTQVVNWLITRQEQH